jgi:protein TonB
MHSAVQALPSVSSERALSQPASETAPIAHPGVEHLDDTATADTQPRMTLQGSRARRMLLALVVAGAHLAGLATLAHLGMQQPTPPEIVPIQVALIEAEPVAQPAPAPVPAPTPAPPTPAPPAPAPPPSEVRRPEPPPPPKPVPRKPTPKPVVSKPAPVTESPSALRAPAEAVPEPAAPAPAPPAAAAPAPPAPAAPAAPAAAAVTAARFDAAYLNNPRPAYPMLSRRLREEGQVMLRVLVSPEGQPARVELRTSSGSDRLDRAAQEAVARWRFVPARRGDVAVEAWVLVPIVFKLQGN